MVQAARPSPLGLKIVLPERLYSDLIAQEGICDPIIPEQSAAPTEAADLTIIQI